MDLLTETLNFMPKPERYDNINERKQAWQRLLSNPDFSDFFIRYYVEEKIELIDKRIVKEVTPDQLEAARASRNALEELQKESSPENFTIPK